MTARAAVVATLAAVPQIGRVHAFERFATAQADLKALYYSDAHSQLRGWFVRRVRLYKTGVIKPRYIEVEQFQIRGFMAWDDANASEITMSNLIDAVDQAFYADPTLGGAVTKQGALSAGSDQGIRLDDFGPVLLAGVLCHGARMSLTTYTEK